MVESKIDLPLDMLIPLNEAALISKTDLDGVITFVNEQFCRSTGYSEAEIIGKKHSFFKSQDTKNS